MLVFGGVTNHTIKRQYFAIFCEWLGLVIAKKLVVFVPAEERSLKERELKRTSKTTNHIIDPRHPNTS